MTQEEFLRIEKLKITKQVWVDGKFCKPGEVVEVKGNDKMELLGSKKAERVSDEKKK